MSDTPASPQLRRPPAAVVRNLHRIHHSPEADQAALDMLSDSTVAYRRLVASLKPEAQARVTVNAWRARAELYRRIAAHETIID